MADGPISADPLITDPNLIDRIPVISTGVNKAITYPNLVGSLTTSNITDFDTGVTNNSSVVANTAKNSYPSIDQTKLGNLDEAAQWIEGGGSVSRPSGNVSIENGTLSVKGGGDVFGIETTGDVTTSSPVFQRFKDINGTQALVGFAGAGTRFDITNAAGGTILLETTGAVGVGASPDANTKLDVDGVIRSKSYTVATLPTVIETAVGIIVTDDVSGETPAWCDGSNWKRFDTNVNITT